MKRTTKNVYQFKITLKEIKPPIWRRIQVPENYTFWDLHVAIQDSMGWLDYHLHSFYITNPETREEDEIGIPSDDFIENTPVIPGWEEKINDWFTDENRKAEYTYDFGDNWTHEIKLEKILPNEEGVKYPVCVAGKRACPPEDCGGPWEYSNFLNAISDPDHEEHERMLEWVGGMFDPEDFDPADVYFDDPKSRLKDLE